MWLRDANPLYTIEVEVTDASRRTIEGQGSVRVAKQQYFAFLNAKQGYYQVGDHVPREPRGAPPGESGRRRQEAGHGG